LERLPRPDRGIKFFYMRITFIATKLNLNKGGSNPDLDLKIKTLAGLGHVVKLVTVFSDLNKLPAPPPCQIFEESIFPRTQFNIQKQIFSLLKKYESATDVFHIEGHFLYGGGLYRLVGGKIPVVAFFNRELVSWPPFSDKLLTGLKQRARFRLEKYLGAKLANRLDFFIFTSPQMEKNYLAFGLKKAFSLALPDFVDMAETRRWAEQNPPVEKGGAHKIFCAGRLVPEKRFDLVIKAAALLKNKYPIELIVGGSGPNLENLKKIAADCGAEKITSFPGWLGRAELMRNFQECDICVTPPWRPDISSVQLLEAMALKTPCLVPADTAFAWIAGGGAAVYRADDINDLVEQIDRIIEDEELARNLGQAGEKRALELDCLVLAEQLASIMEKLSVDKNHIL